jgi:hypothetical protein
MIAVTNFIAIYSLKMPALEHRAGGSDPLERFADAGYNPGFTDVTTTTV